MQLLLTKSELQLLADLLAQKRYAISQTTQPISDRERMLARDLDALLGKVIEHDIHFSCDELVTLTDFLNECDRDIKKAGATDETCATLEAMLDKFVEACAMV
jgi:hypothetical protein